MYTPAHFAVDDETAAHYVAAVVAGDLVTMTDDGLVATFLPLLHNASGGPMGALVGHVARTNDQWRRARHGEAMVIARGPDAYVSPSWYATKAEHGRVVPTWNYETAHIYGHLVVHEDVEWLDSLVRRLTDRHESPRDEPWTVDDAPAAFVAGQLRAIVGVELVISRVEVKVKMSQNRPDADIDGVVAGLEEDGRADAAALVESSRPDYYSTPGVPTVVVTAADLDAGASLTLEAPPVVALDPRVERAVNDHDIRCEVLACDPAFADTAAFCAHYGFALEQAANTILVASKKVEPPSYAVCVVLGTTRLDVNRKVSELLGVKRLSFADAEVTQHLTGMMIGGVTAIGIDDLPIYVDAAVMDQPQIVMGGGNRSSKLLLSPGELTKLPNVEVVEGLALPR